MGSSFKSNVCDFRSEACRPDFQALAAPFIEARHRRLAEKKMGNHQTLSRGAKVKNAIVRQLMNAR
jgi:hypothetical protein